MSREYTELQIKALQLRSDMAIGDVIDLWLLSPEGIWTLRNSGLFIPIASIDKQRAYKGWMYSEGRA